MPPDFRPLVIFDGDCGFCRRWIDRWREETGDAVDYAPYQEVAARFPEVPVEAFRHAVHFVDARGKIHRGAEAVFLALAVSPLKSVPLFLYRHLPGARAISEAAYRRVADHRPTTDRITLMLWGRDVRRPAYRIAADLFLRGLGLVYLIAFLSLAVQVRGLIGARGILPAADLMEMARTHFGAVAWMQLPTLAWFNASDPFLLFLCYGGALCGALAFLRLAAFPALLIAWAFYLSLAVAGQEFLGFQWDNLLLEAGFLALFITPFRFRVRFASIPSAPFGLFLLRWLLFRLMFASGVVKLTSGDPAWRNLTALSYHYETQCLPTWVAWYAHQLPMWFQKLSALAMFGVELVLPFLIFLPRKLRMTACGGFVVLQILTMLTGNYTFFNLLTIVLCLLLIDDAMWPEWLRRAAGAERRPGRTPVAARPLLAVLLLLSFIPLTAAFRKPVSWPAPVRRVYGAVFPFRSLNAYGLFAVMTTERREISIEGSRDGVTWRTYPFRWKPGDPLRRPAFVAPHQPRLDWQMWFAALGDVRRNPWLVALAGRLAEGSPEVLDLLAVNPFPEAPPARVRAVIRTYRFSTPAERRETGAWWVAEGEPALYWDSGAPR